MRQAHTAGADSRDVATVVVAGGGSGTDGCPWGLPANLGSVVSNSDADLNADTNADVKADLNASLDAIFKAYDIRGIVGEQLNAGVCRAIGRAFGLFVSSEGADSVVIGRDMRPDGVELSQAFADGVSSTGVDVVDIGLCATEMAYLASGLMSMPAAVFTASHNPVGYNGIKLCGPGAAPIAAGAGLDEIKALALSEGSGTGTAAARGKYTQTDLLERYVEHVLSFVDTDSLAPMRVCVDVANGMGGLVVPAVFSALPVELDCMYADLDGTFPNHPADPLNPDNLVDLQAQVIDTSADVGLAFDGDADRVFALDETGRALSGSLTASIIAQSVLRGEPDAVVVYNVICSAALPELVTEMGGRAIRCRVGHSFMKRAMADSGAAFGGEHSGHYYFRGNYGADSAMIAALLLLESLSGHDGPLSDLAAPLDRYRASGEINSVVQDPAAVIARVSEAFAGFDQDRLDGLTVRCDGWWFNLRPSNTEPLLRLNLEAATTAEVQSRTAEVLSLLAL